MEESAGHCRTFLYGMFVVDRIEGGLALTPKHRQETLEWKLEFSEPHEMTAILGRQDEYLRQITEQFPCRIIPRGNEIQLAGDAEIVQHAVRLIEELRYLVRDGNPLTTHDVRYAIQLVKKGRGEHLHEMFSDTIVVTHRGRHVKPKTLGQKDYIELIRQSDVTFGIGPAGTGKTYLAVAMAVYYLKNKLVERIILTRPAVEAGEKLGFLPGDLQEKVDPYLRPLYDGLYEILGMDSFQKLMAKQIIEVAPLAYMRGRTLDAAFVILDEAQNTTPPQMKMFLTRLGFGSKMVITGDVTQMDLPVGSTSGLKQAVGIFRDVPGIGTAFLNDTDVIRHEVVSRIIREYERHEAHQRK